jgi:hypothetical protein
MAGQIGTGTFDVSGLIVTEPATADQPTNIIPVGGAFDLSVTFKGTGASFNGFENLKTDYTVSYFMEGIGASADEKDLGTVGPKQLIPGHGTYKDADTRLSVTGAANTLKPGIYRVGALVTFPLVPGMTGFVEDRLVEIFKP